MNVPLIGRGGRDTPWRGRAKEYARGTVRG